MNTSRFIAVAAGAVTVAVVATPMAASAAPANGNTIHVSCQAPIGSTDVTTPPGNGSFTPAFIAGTHELLIPYSITGTFTPAGGTPVPFSDVKKAPVPANAIKCTFSETFSEGGSSATVTGTVVAVPRGKP